VVAIWYHIEHERRSMLAHWRNRVATIADDRVRFVESWLAARQGDAKVLATSPIVRALLKGEGSAEAVVTHLNQVRAAYGYASIWVFDARGWLAARGSHGRLPDPEGPDRPERRGARPAGPLHLDADLRGRRRPTR
jgi:hypothetical protein